MRCTAVAPGTQPATAPRRDTRAEAKASLGPRVVAHLPFANLATLVVGDRRRLQRISARTCFPDFAWHASHLSRASLCARSRARTHANGRLQPPSVSPVGRPAAASWSGRRRQSARSPGFPRKGAPVLARFWLIPTAPLDDNRQSTTSRRRDASSPRGSDSRGPGTPSAWFSRTCICTVTPSIARRRRPSKFRRLVPSPKLSGAATRKHAGGATIAFLKSDRHERPRADDSYVALCAGGL
jgi:hypothetical protein